MKKLLLAGCLWPALINAQVVQPVLSEDYRTLIRKDSSAVRWKDSSNSLRHAPLHFTGYIFRNQFLVKRVQISRNNKLQLQPANTHYLYFSGSFASTIETKHHNRTPLLQEEYAQGRAVNGQLNWQGPETGELFSYGPALANLEFDGSSYAYDKLGRLTIAGTGNGIRANNYSNSLLRPSTFFSNNLVVSARYQTAYSKYLGVQFKAGQSSEKTILLHNKNKARHYTVTANSQLNKLMLNAGYTFREEKFDHSNRNGYLNRIYMNSLLSPVSFSNSQGLTTGNQQRAYSPMADNPLFLLDNPQQGSVQQQQTVYLNQEHRFGNVKIKLSQSLEKGKQQNRESYQPGTAFFPSGVSVNRNSYDKNYQLRGEIEYTVPFDNYKFNAQLNGIYQHAVKQSVIDYMDIPVHYRYQRSVQDASISFLPYYRSGSIETGIALNNKFYVSNTSVKNNFWLPSISAYHLFRELFDSYSCSLKLTASYNRFDSEVPVSQSFAGTGLVQTNPSLAGLFLPQAEVNGFTGLHPVEHREYQAGLEFMFKNKIQVTAGWFHRRINNDVFPFVQGSRLILDNMASHYTRGTELQIEFNRYLSGSKKINAGGALLFIKWKSRVIDVKDGFNFHPLFGFSNVHKALVRGEPLGVIMGNSWLRDAESRKIIGSDGFPLVDNQLKVLGNPIPDFILKFSQKLRYKQWDLFIDWEWKKGGDMWNGTAAMLDYYGRSANTGTERNTRDYIFEGVLINGNHNSLPVNFYDPALPFSQNRWVRYGAAGVAEDYIQKADMLRISMISISWNKMIRKFLPRLSLGLYANNLLIWSPYKGTDTNQLMYDQAGSQGLDFFNLPATRTAGFKMSIQF